LAADPFVWYQTLQNIPTYNIFDVERETVVFHYRWQPYFKMAAP